MILKTPAAARFKHCPGARCSPGERGVAIALAGARASVVRGVTTRLVVRFGARFCSVRRRLWAGTRVSCWDSRVAMARGLMVFLGSPRGSISAGEVGSGWFYSS